MRVPILSGIYSDLNSDFRTFYPRNLIPVPKVTGISESYLRPAPGLVQVGTGPGKDRGGINYNDVMYRVMGNELVQIDYAGTVTTLGTVSGSKQATLQYSRDYVFVSADNNFYAWDGTTFTQVIDVQLGQSIDSTWLGGYFVSTDGRLIVYSEINNPLVWDSSFGSGIDPDPVNGVLTLRNELYAFNRHTIQVFRLTGDGLDPFALIQGATFQRGSIGTHSKAVYMEQLVFLGGGRNEAPAIWIGANGTTSKISTREIDLIIQQYTESQLKDVVFNVQVDQTHQFLWVNLPNQTLVYDGVASRQLQQPIWFVLSSALVGDSQYRAINPVWVYDNWYVGDPTSTNFGTLSNSIGSHWGEKVGWEVRTPFAYNEAKGGILHSVELVGLPGRQLLGDNPTVYTSYTLDGLNYSQEIPLTLGANGNYEKRIVWYQQGWMKSYRGQKFRGDSDARLSIASVEAEVEPLNV